MLIFQHFSVWYSANLTSSETVKSLCQFFMLKRDLFVAPIKNELLKCWLVSVSQSINQSFILARYNEELKNSFKIRTCINKIYNNYSYNNYNIILF